MKITHTFRSGNDCIVTVPNRITPGVYDEVSIEWEHFPPSQEDAEEYKRQVAPKIHQEIDRLAQRKFGAGSMREVMPGIWAWDKEKSSLQPWLRRSDGSIN